jgi:tRNA G37 N-methylase TrmD
MLVFHNGSNVSYANFAGNLSSMSSATTAVTLRFLGQGASATATSTDAVVLTVTAGYEEVVMEFLAGLMAGGNKRGMTVVADDQNSVYSHDKITAVDSISVDSGAGTFKNVIVGAFSSHDLALTNAQSGSLVTIPTTGDNSTITLPSSPVEGCNYRLVCEAASGAHTITIAGEFEGIVLDNTHASTLDNTTNIQIASNKFEIGDYLELIYSTSAAKWKVFGMGISDDWVAAN